MARVYARVSPGSSRAGEGASRPPLGLGGFISVGRSLDVALDRVVLAERLGYEAMFVTQIADRDSLTTLMADAARTERIRLGTRMMPIYTRKPVTTTMSAATVDECSGDRLVLSLGVADRATIQAWFNDEIRKPIDEMREYVGTVRAVLRGTEHPRGERLRSRYQFIGHEPRDGLPIYVGALAPGMLRLGGEIADGVVLWLCTPG